jgi:hypothetical protein
VADNGSDENRSDESGTGRTQRRPGVDAVTLLAGLVVLAVSSFVLTDGLFGLAAPGDPRWLLAGGAVLVGTLMLGISLRPGRRRRVDD